MVTRGESAAAAGDATVSSESLVIEEFEYSTAQVAYQHEVRRFSP